MICIIKLSKVHLSLELSPSARGTERLISESWGGFLCVGSCGDGGGCVSRSMWKASLFQRSSLVWEREDWRQTWIQPCDWARSREQHSPTTLQILIGMYNSVQNPCQNEGFLFSSPQMKHKEQLRLLKLFAVLHTRWCSLLARPDKMTSSSLQGLF